MKILYKRKIAAPNLDQIHSDVGNGVMVEKSIEYCRWDGVDAGPDGANTLSIHFTTEPTGANRRELDNIVTSNS